MRWIAGFGRFWYDFIVGDSVALAIGGVGVITAGALLVWIGVAGPAQVFMPIIVAATIAISLRWPK